MGQPISTNIHDLIEAVDRADSAPSLIGAVRSLAAAEDPEAVPKLIQVLGFNNPGAAVAAVNGLVRLGDPAVIPLIEELDGYNYGARAWAIRALAEIGDPRALDILLAAAGDFALSVRRAASKGLGTLHWQQLNANERSPGQRRALDVLIKATTDPEWVVRYAAIVGLEALGSVFSDAGDRQTTRQCLEAIARDDEELGVRGRSQLAVQRLANAEESA